MTDLNEWKREQRHIALEQKKRKLEEIKERSRRVTESKSSSSPSGTNVNSEVSRPKIEASKILEELSATSDIDS